MTTAELLDDRIAATTQPSAAPGYTILAASLPPHGTLAFVEGHAFIAETVIPALAAVRQAVEQTGARTRLLNCQTHARLVVTRAGHAEFSYAVRLRLTAEGVVPYSEASGRHGGHWRWSDGFDRWEGCPSPVHTTTTLTREAITHHALAWYAQARARPGSR